MTLEINPVDWCAPKWRRSLIRSGEQKRGVTGRLIIMQVDQLWPPRSWRRCWGRFWRRCGGGRSIQVIRGQALNAGLACTKHGWGTILWCMSELNCDVCLKHIIITCFTPETEVWLTPMIHLSYTSVDKSGFSNRLCPCDPEKITWPDAPFTSTSFPSTEDRQVAAEWMDGQRVAVWCHVGVYLSTTTGRNTSRAQPGQGQWIWLGQAAIWMARGRGGGRRGIRRNQPANQPKPTWRMEQLLRRELLLMSFYKKDPRVWPVNPEHSPPSADCWWSQTTLPST